jgi:phosphatidylglycerophosphate synthase
MARFIMERYSDPGKIRDYRYQSINNSLLDKYVLRHWWKVAIKAIPARMPANLVSILGNAGSWLAFLILSGLLFGPMEIAGRQRPWLFLVAALGLAFYQTLDALDGIQARRTGAAGPLGEFVDHWFDSFNAFLLPLGIALAFPIVHPIVSGLVVYLFLAADFLTLEGVRKRGILVFGPFSTEEALFCDILILIGIAIFGYDFWAGPLLFGLAPIHLIFIVAGLSIAAVSIRCLAETGGLARAVVEALFLAPIVAWTALAYTGSGRQALLCGGLLLGFSASRFSGDLLRERLMGLEYAPFPRDLPVAEAFLLVSVCIRGLPAWAPMAVGWAFLAWTLATLALQFKRALARVRSELGIGILGSTRNAMAAAKSESAVSGP